MCGCVFPDMEVDVSCNGAETPLHVPHLESSKPRRSPNDFSHRPMVVMPPESLPIGSTVAARVVIGGGESWIVCEVVAQHPARDAYTVQDKYPDIPGKPSQWQLAASEVRRFPDPRATFHKHESILCLWYETASRQWSSVFYNAVVLNVKAGGKQLDVVYEGDPNKRTVDASKAVKKPSKVPKSPTSAISSQPRTAKEQLLRSIGRGSSGSLHGDEGSGGEMDAEMEEAAVEADDRERRRRRKSRAKTERDAVKNEPLTVVMPPCTKAAEMSVRDKMRYRFIKMKGDNVKVTKSPPRDTLSPASSAATSSSSSPSAVQNPFFAHTDAVNVDFVVDDSDHIAIRFVNLHMDADVAMPDESHPSNSKLDVDGTERFAKTHRQSPLQRTPHSPNVMKEEGAAQPQTVAPVL